MKRLGAAIDNNRELPPHGGRVAEIARVGPCVPSHLNNDSQHDPSSPRCIELIDSAGAHISTIDETRARWLLRTKRATSIVTKHGRIRALRLISEEELIADGSGPTGRHYAHHHDSYDNPTGVWTLRRLPRSWRPFFAPRDVLAA